MHRAVFSLSGMGLLRLSKWLLSYAMHVGYAIIPVGKFLLGIAGRYTCAMRSVIAIMASLFHTRHSGITFRRVASQFVICSRFLPISTTRLVALIAVQFPHIIFSLLRSHVLTHFVELGR